MIVGAPFPPVTGPDTVGTGTGDAAGRSDFAAAMPVLATTITIAAKTTSLRTGHALPEASFIRARRPYIDTSGRSRRGLLP